MYMKARESMFYVSLNGARGHRCIDEGDEYRPAIYERSLLDALYVARNPLGNSPAELALRDRARNSKDIRELRTIAELFAEDPPESLIRARKIKVVKDVTDSRYLHPKQRFFIERDRGAKQLMDDHAFTGITDKRAAETEWMKRQAEWDTGVSRDDPDAGRRKDWERAYNALRQHDNR
jgi:hypothetical protein